MFESLTDRLQDVFKRLRGKGLLTEKDVHEALREVRLALLAADVNFKVVKDFLARVEEKAVGKAVLESLTPGQEVIRVVRDELIALMGEHANPILFASQPPTVIYLVGLQGSGKTTTAAKLARVLKKQGKHPLMVAADIYRPAAIDQLQSLAKSLDVPVYTEPGLKPVDLARHAVAESKRLARDVVVVDTAGRLHVDAELMDELHHMVEVLPPHEVWLVVDAMTGQDAVRVAEAFHQTLALTGVVLTKLDGDARGGAALSIRAVTSVPIKYVATGEKLDALEPFYPDRIASRILGMGDVMSLIERAEEAIDVAESEQLAKKIQHADFTLEDFQSMLKQVQKLGPLSKVMEMIPGMRGAKLPGTVDDRRVVRIEAILNSMTMAEKRRPQLIDGSRRRRIARGSGTTVQDVNQLLRQYEEMRKLMRQMKSQGKRRRGRPPFPLPEGLDGLDRL